MRLWEFAGVTFKVFFLQTFLAKLGFANKRFLHVSIIVFNIRHQTQRLIFRRSSFLIRFTFWSRFSFYISHDLHAWLRTYLTHYFNWIDFKFFTLWIPQYGECGQCQKSK